LLRIIRPQLRTTRRLVLAAATPSVLLIVLVPHFTVAPYGDLVAQSVDRHREVYVMHNKGRSFYYGRRDAAEAVPTDGIDLAGSVTTEVAYTVGDPDAPFHVVAYDLGIKRTILRHLTGSGCFVEVVPAGTAASDVLARDPDGIFLSNGPGDPAAVTGTIDALGGLVGRGVPIFGICLGHQVLGLALGGRTTKLPFGHHGANHPVRHEPSGRVEITSQNHNYAVDATSLPEGSVVTHLNLNDGDVEGVRTADRRAFSVQYHPEAGPGPHDARYLFGDFIELMREAA